MSKVAVVTGSNKGIGFGIVKALCQTFDGVVFLTSRSETRGREAVQELSILGLKPEYHQLDVADRSSVEQFKEYLLAKHSGIDILINNAGVADSPYINNSIENCELVININFYGLLNIQDIIFPIVRNGGRILNVSSDCGHLSNIRNKFWIDRLLKKDLRVDDVKEFIGWFLNTKRNGTFKKDDIVDDATVAAYRVSKVAICALTLIQQKLYEAKDISINSLHPGVVKTEMTGGVGFYSIDAAAKTPLYVVLEAPKSLRGAYVWFDKKIIDWYDYKSTDYYFRLSSLSEYR